MPLRPLLLLALLLSLPACDSLLARRIVQAPNTRLWPLATPATQPANVPGPAWLNVQRTLTIPVQNASLSAWVLEPTPPDSPSPATQPTLPPSPPRATILVLHGIDANAFYLLPTGNYLRHAGYRVVLVDLRGHGQSTGEFITYGVQESADLSAVLDYLDHEHLLAGPVGVYGISYGAATAIQFAARDPRVKAVVAVASYATFRAEVPHFGRTLMPFIGWWISDAHFDSLVDQAGQLAHFDPDAASPLRAITQTHTPILLLHGAIDMINPADSSRQLHAAAPDHTQLILLQAEGHTIAQLDPTGQIKHETLQWFQENLPAPKNQ